LRKDEHLDWQKLFNRREVESMGRTLLDILNSNDATKNLIRLIYSLFGILFITFATAYVIVVGASPSRVILLITSILLITLGGLKFYLWRDKR
jgi:hypothetical protein